MHTHSKVLHISQISFNKEKSHKGVFFFVLEEKCSFNKCRTLRSVLWKVCYSFSSEKLNQDDLLTNPFSTLSINGCLSGLSRKEILGEGS